MQVTQAHDSLKQRGYPVWMNRAGGIEAFKEGIQDAGLYVPFITRSVPMCRIVDNCVGFRSSSGRSRCIK